MFNHSNQGDEVMRTGDLLISNHPCDERQCASNRGTSKASAVIGTIVAVGLVAMAWAGAYSARPDPPYTEDPEVSAVARQIERSGTLVGFEILF
jgi:hypothetical protein